MIKIGHTKSCAQCGYLGGGVPVVFFHHWAQPPPKYPTLGTTPPKYPTLGTYFFVKYPTLGTQKVVPSVGYLGWVVPSGVSQVKSA